jgi:hypothetical protein
MWSFHIDFNNKYLYCHFFATFLPLLFPKVSYLFPTILIRRFVKKNYRNTFFDLSKIHLTIIVRRSKKTRFYKTFFHFLILDIFFVHFSKTSWTFGKNIQSQNKTYKQTYLECYYLKLIYHINKNKKNVIKGTL